MAQWLRSLACAFWRRRAAAKRRCADAVGAFACAARAATAGDAPSQAEVANCYLYGRGVPPSLREAARWFERAGAAGHVDAMVQLAKLALQGLIRSGAAEGPDFATGYRWATLASTAGSVEGTLLLANVCLYGPSPWREASRAIRLFRSAAGSGSPAGCLGLAMALLHAGPDPARRDEIHSLILAAADGNLPMGLYLAGFMAELGLGRARDAAAALACYRRAAEAGVRAAQTRYGYALLHGQGIARNAEAAETWLRKAALAGDAAAAAIVAELYATPGDHPPNHAEATCWLTRAAELGHTGAASALTALSSRGERLSAFAYRADAARPQPIRAPAVDPATLLAPGCRYPDATFARRKRAATPNREKAPV